MLTYIVMGRGSKLYLYIALLLNVATTEKSQPKVEQSSSELDIISRSSTSKQQDLIYLADSILTCYKANTNFFFTLQKEANNNEVHCKVNTELTTLNYCITFNRSTNLTEIGECIYVSSQNLGDKELSNVSRLADSICGKFKRNGTLCGKCQDGYSPLAYSYDMKCVQCPHGASNWWKYLLAAFLPLTVFYFIIALLKINITSSYLHGFVFYAQIISNPAIFSFILATANYNTTYARWFGCLYQVWNLDFFRLVIPSICLGTNTLQTIALDYTIGIYPIILLITSYLLIYLHDKKFKLFVWIWKPFRALISLFSSNWEIKTSLIDAFATFLLLSNFKISSTSFNMLIPVTVYQLNTTGELEYSWRLYFDATLVYFGPDHLPYAILAIVMLLVFVILPMLLLFLYPFRWFHKFLNLFPFRWYVLHTFVDSFQGCYKDGTEPGTRDCRWFASLFLVVRLLLRITGSYALGVLFYTFSTIIVVIVCILLISIQPFKESLRHHSYINAMFLLLLVLVNTLILAKEYAKVNHVKVPVFFSGVLGTIPLFYITGLILFWMYRNRRFGREFLQRLQHCRQGYKLLE